MHLGLEGILVINRIFKTNKRETSQKEVKWQLFMKAILYLQKTDNGLTQCLHCVHLFH